MICAFVFDKKDGNTKKNLQKKKYCSSVTRGEMNKVMIIEKQRFGRGLIREISKYVYKNPIVVLATKQTLAIYFGALTGN